MREKKWRRHFHQCGLIWPNPSCLEALLQHLDKEVFSFYPTLKVVPFFEEYLYQNDAEPELQNSRGVYEKEYFVLYPHRWARKIVERQAVNKIALENQLEAELFEEQIRWEIAGLFSQYRFLGERWMLEQINAMQQMLASHSSLELKEGLNRLREMTLKFHRSDPVILQKKVWW